MPRSRSKPGPLGPFVEGYRAWLLGRGYSPSVVVRSLITLGHLGRWLEPNALAVDQLTAEAISTFLAEYRVDHGRLPGASVWPLHEYLRAEGAVPQEPPEVVAPVEQLIGEYREWLVCERGLAPVTLRANEQFARRFLAGRVSAADACGELGITAGEVNALLVRERARGSSGSVGCFTYRLRSLLRYLALRGFADPGLAPAVPRVARWREATIPQFPTRPQIDRLLASCDRQDTTGARLCGPAAARTAGVARGRSLATAARRSRLARRADHRRRQGPPARTAPAAQRRRRGHRRASEASRPSARAAARVRDGACADSAA